MPRALPAMDLVARGLSAIGHARAAIALLELTIPRGGDEAMRCQALLTALRTQPGELLGSPGVRIDVELIESLATHGRIREALLVAQVVESSGTVLGIEIVHALELVLAPLPHGEPADMAACYRDGLEGSAVAAQRVALAPNASAELRRRAQTLVQLLRGFRAMSAAPGATEGLAVDAQVVAVVAEMLSRRDLLWGRRALAQMLTLPGGQELHEAVDLLVRATDGVANEENTGQPVTAPLEGDGVALLHVRMVNLEQAERALRRICAENPANRLAPSLLSAVARVRAVQDASLDPGRSSLEPSGTRGGPPPEWLNKRARKASVEGWAGSGRRGGTPVAHEEPVTSVLRPDDEAELHLRAGRPDKAIELYERLAQRFPDRPRFRERAAEIAQQMEARSLMFADEMTVRRDVRELASVISPPKAAEAPAAEADALRRARGEGTIEMQMVFSGEEPLPEETTDASATVVGLVDAGASAEIAEASLIDAASLAPAPAGGSRLASGLTQSFEPATVVAVRPIIGIG